MINAFIFLLKLENFGRRGRWIRCEWHEQSDAPKPVIGREASFRADNTLAQSCSRLTKSVVVQISIGCKPCLM